MSVVIRLRREGARNKPYFRIVAADSRMPRDGKFIEILGSYNAEKSGDKVQVKTDRLKWWLSKGAKPSDRVASIIKKQKLL